MDNATAISIGRDVAAVIAFVYAVVQGLSASRAKQQVETARAEVEEVKARTENATQSDLARTNSELATAFKIKSEEWQAAWKKEHDESIAYHDWVHEKSQKDQALHLTIVEENANLRARTDLTPLIDHMDKVLTAITKLTVVVNVLFERVAPEDFKKQFNQAS